MNHSRSLQFLVKAALIITQDDIFIYFHYEAEIIELQQFLSYCHDGFFSKEKLLRLSQGMCHAGTMEAQKKTALRFLLINLNRYLL